MKRVKYRIPVADKHVVGYSNFEAALRFAQSESLPFKSSYVVAVTGTAPHRKGFVKKILARFENGLLTEEFKHLAEFYKLSVFNMPPPAMGVEFQRIAISIVEDWEISTRESALDLVNSLFRLFADHRVEGIAQ